MQAALRQVLRVEVGRADEERVRVRDRARAEADAQDIAHDAADARARAAVGIDRAGVVVGLDLERHVVTGVELDDARVVVEHADAPGCIDLEGRRRDRLLQEVLVDERRVAGLVVRELDAAREGLVLAVLAPGLRQGLELAGRRLATEVRVELLDARHLEQGQRELSLGAELLQGGLVEAEQRHFDATTLGTVVLRLAEGQVLATDAQVLDDRVAERARGGALELVDVGLIRFVVELEGIHLERLRQRRRPDQRALEYAPDTLRTGVHHAGFLGDQHADRAAGVAGHLAGSCNVRLFEDGVAEQLGADALDELALELGRQQVSMADTARPRGGCSELAYGMQGLLTRRIVPAGQLEDLDAPGGGDSRGRGGGRRLGHGRRGGHGWWGKRRRGVARSHSNWCHSPTPCLRTRPAKKRPRPVCR